MFPALFPGDRVRVRVGAECARGDLVVVVGPRGDCVVHRLLALSAESGLLTRGDASPDPDPPAPPHALVGRVVGVRRRLFGFWVEVPTPLWRHALPRPMARGLLRALLSVRQSWRAGIWPARLPAMGRPPSGRTS